MITTLASVMYRIFYIILHCVYTIFELIRDCSRTFYHEFSATKRAVGVNIGKPPRHVTVILGPEEPSYADLSNLILWCMASSVPFVSFYDHKGSLNASKLQWVVDEKKLMSDHVIWHNNPDDVHKNGYVGRKIHVKILEKDAGKGAIVKLCKDPSLSDFSVDNLEGRLRKGFEFPDPDLGMCCGKTFCLFGYPPWQIRVTEFFNVETHHHLSMGDFADLLSRYNKCEQRFGK